MGTLWNTYAFYVLYANIDEFDPTKYSLDYDKLSVMDKWLLSKLNTAVKTCDENLGAYRIPEAARALFIHPNTMRYRLNRIREVAGLTLEDMEELKYLRLSDWLERE